MLTEFDQTTIANMTAALDFVCKKIPADKDSNEPRKRIGDELVRCARMGRRSLIDLQQAGMKVMEETATPTRSSWFAWKEVALECLSTHCALHLEAELTFFPSQTSGFRSRRFMRKARDRTAVAVRLSSIPISLASIPFNDNSRRRSSSAAVQSFTDDLLSPIASVIGLAPSSPSVPALDEAGNRLPYSTSSTLPISFPAGRAVQKWAIQAQQPAADHRTCKAVEAMTTARQRVFLETDAILTFIPTD
jgi:hypothetical protein